MKEKLPFDFNNLRSDFSDEYYGALGRALAVITRYESNCRALATLLRVKTSSRTPSLAFSLNNTKQFNEFLSDIANNMRK